MADLNSFVINKDFNPVVLENVIRRYWYKPFILIGISLIVAFTYLRYKKPIYESNASLQVIQEDRVKEVLGSESSPITASNDISKEVELLRSEVLFGQMLNKLNLTTSISSEGKFLIKDLYGVSPFSIITYDIKDSSICGERIDVSIDNGNLIHLNYAINGRLFHAKGIINQEINNQHFKISLRTSEFSAFKDAVENNKIFFVFNNKQILLDAMKSNLSVNPIDESAKTILISYSDHNPILCRDVVQTILNVYLNYDKQNKQSKTDNTIAFIDQQLDSLSRILKNSKDSLSDFQRSERLPNPEKAEIQLSDNINDLTQRLLETNEEISTLAMVNSRINIDPNRLEIYRLIPEMVGKKSFEGTVLRQVEDLNKLLETEEDLLRDVTQENRQIKVINERINNRIFSIKKSLKIIDERLRHDRSMIQEKINEIEGEYYGLPEKTMEFERLKYMEELNNRYFSLFTEKKIEFELSNAGYSTSNRILSEPMVPTDPMYPRVGVVYLFAFLLGLVSGLGLLVIRYLTYNEITTLQDLQSLLPTETNFLGSIPLYKKKMKFSQVVVNESSKSRLAESIRNIRANMSFINKDAKVIAISSSVSGEGKTFVVLNLAGMIALGGKKTILIDLDLRKPKVHLGVNADNHLGMSNLLSGHSSLGEVIQSSEIPGLDFITAGPIPPNPSELIQGVAFQQFLEDLKLKYDIILIDNPPVGIVSDGIHILAQADIPIYVFKSKYSKRIFAQRVEELFSIQKLKSLNVILNGVDEKRSFYGYGYGYGYGYTNSGYYSDDAEVSFLRKIWNKISNLWRRRN
jgi:capsular exopolysaccharide synthesis family protein